MKISKKLVWVGLFAYPLAASAGVSSPSACGLELTLNYGSNVYLLSQTHSLLSTNTPIVTTTPVCSSSQSSLLPAYSLHNQADTAVASLSTGLTLTSATGAIEGDPTAVLAETWYTMALKQDGYTKWQGLSLQVEHQTTALNYSSAYNFTCGTSVGTVEHTAPTTGIGVTSYSISCVNSSNSPVPLATGLAFNTANGYITGTPTQVLSETCTVTGNNNLESLEQTFAINVKNISPTAFTPISATVYNGVPADFNPITHAECMTPAYNYSISPAMSNGLSFNGSTGAVTGVPDYAFTGTVAAKAVSYTITVNGTTAKTAPKAVFSIAYEKATAAAPAAFSYPATALSVGFPASLAPSLAVPADIAQNVAFQIAAGSAPTCTAAGYGINGGFSAVPIGNTGLTFNQLNGVISGTPSQTFNQTYYVTACGKTTKSATVVLQANQITQIAAGQSHTCAIINGGAWCWGQNTDGQAGLNPDMPSTVTSGMSRVQGINGTVTKITAGDSHTCAIAGGNAYCWGLNTDGQLGVGSSESNSYEAVQIPLAGTVTDIAAGGAHTCAVAGGMAYCWGANQAGQVGAPVNYGVDDGDVVAPAPIALATTVSHIAAGENHSCAIETSGSIWCWGDNAYGELGNGNGLNDQAGIPEISTQPNIPVQVTGMGGQAIAISAAGAHTCAIVNNPSNVFSATPSNENLFVECWGDNASTWIPKSVNSRGTVIASYSGSQLGTQCADTAYKATGLSPVTAPCPLSATAAPITGFWGISNSPSAIATGWASSCEIFNGHATCWGSNIGASPVASNGPVFYGLLGNGTTTSAATVKSFINSSSAPVSVATTSAPNAVTAIAAGADHACAIVDGHIACWGDDGVGQLGINPCMLTASACSVGALKPGVTVYETSPVAYTALLPM